MKDALVAKLSAQCDELYTEAFKQMQKESLHPLWERGDYDWLAIVGGKQSAYRGLAQYYQSLVCNAGKNVGEEISRLQVLINFPKGSIIFFTSFSVCLGPVQVCPAADRQDDIFPGSHKQGPKGFG
jgi:hypothetical protein